MALRKVSSIPKEKEPFDNFLYIVQRGSYGPVKIGRAHNPAARLANLQQGSPEKLWLVRRYKLMGSHESYLYELLRDWGYHLRGEWFTDEAIKFVDGYIYALTKNKTKKLLQRSITYLGEVCKQPRLLGYVMGVHYIRNTYRFMIKEL